MATSPKPKRTPRLGRGLSSMVGQSVQVQPPTARETPNDESPAASPLPEPRPAPGASSIDSIVYLPLDALTPNRSQPRQAFDQPALARLADSIRVDGIIQPIIARPPNADNQHELVAGERRWRAASLAGLDQIPVIIRDMDDRQAAEWALIENLQREDLNPIERAEAFRNLLDSHGLTHEDIAQRVGADRSSITNTLRLLTLSPEVRELIRTGALSAGQGKALASVPSADQQLALARKAIAQDWSVRKLEGAVRDSALAKQSPDDAGTPKDNRSPHIQDLEQQITRQLGTRVQVKPGRRKGTGKLTIQFYSIEQFDTLLERMGISLD